MAGAAGEASPNNALEVGPNQDYGDYANWNDNAYGDDYGGYDYGSYDYGSYDYGSYDSGGYSAPPAGIQNYNDQAVGLLSSGSSVSAGGGGGGSTFSPGIVAPSGSAQLPSMQTKIDLSANSAISPKQMKS